jgi:four helix bundle protein
MPTKSSIEQLNVYVLAHGLESKVFDLVHSMPTENFYPLGNSLWRSATATAHYIAEAHERFSYTIKIQSLQYGRIAAEETIKHLEEFEQQFGADTKVLNEEFTAVIKQCWGLIKYLQGKQREKAESHAIKAADELVEARSAVAA